MNEKSTQEFTCCGMPMKWQVFFGIRMYVCNYRDHHPRFFVNEQTGLILRDEDLPWFRAPSEEDDGGDWLPGCLSYRARSRAGWPLRGPASLPLGLAPQ